MITQMLGAIKIPSCPGLATILTTVPPHPFSWTGHLDISPDLDIPRCIPADLRDLDTQSLSILCHRICPF